jgi:hypothetical protein
VPAGGSSHLGDGHEHRRQDPHRHDRLRRSARLSTTVTVDTCRPSSAAAIKKAAGGTPGYIRQNGSYRVYAAITDPGSPITTATANVSTITTGTTASALTAGTWTIAGVTYNYRSGALTANNPLAVGAKAFSVTATDSFAHTATTGGFSVMVDNTRPAGSSLTTANSSGGIVGKAETGDSITYTYNEPIDANSIILGWDGTATSVTLRLLNAGGRGRPRRCGTPR